MQHYKRTLKVKMSSAWWFMPIINPKAWEIETRGSHVQHWPKLNSKTLFKHQKDRHKCETSAQSKEKNQQSRPAFSVLWPHFP